MKIVRRIHGPRHRMRKLLIVLGLATAMVLGAQAAAFASFYQNSDSFEGNPASVWTLYHSDPSGGGGFEAGSGTARSGYNDAYLVTQTGWSSVGRTMHITPAQFHQPTCAARIYVEPLGAAKLNFEIINPSTWTYIALTTVTVPAGGYQDVEVGPWYYPGPPIDVFVRVSLLGVGGYSVIRVDDLDLQCQYT